MADQSWMTLSGPGVDVETTGVADDVSSTHEGLDAL